ncbi:hypothetical protein QPK87_27335 [Kamptonema cortianum]|nr:hypothetical protein [Kamptonema cortianum]
MSDDEDFHIYAIPTGKGKLIPLKIASANSNYWMISISPDGSNLLYGLRQSKEVVGRISINEMLIYPIIISEKKTPWSAPGPTGWRSDQKRFLFQTPDYCSEDINEAILSDSLQILDVRCLFSYKNAAFSAQYSPDETKIIFVLFKDGIYGENAEIALAPYQESKQISLSDVQFITHDNIPDSSPHWTACGDKIRWIKNHNKFMEHHLKTSHIDTLTKISPYKADVFAPAPMNLRDHYFGVFFCNNSKTLAIVDANGGIQRLNCDIFEIRDLQWGIIPK